MSPGGGDLRATAAGTVAGGTVRVWFGAVGVPIGFPAGLEVYFRSLQLF